MVTIVIMIVPNLPCRNPAHLLYLDQAPVKSASQQSIRQCLRTNFDFAEKIPAWVNFKVLIPLNVVADTTGCIRKMAY